MLLDWYAIDASGTLALFRVFDGGGVPSAAVMVDSDAHEVVTRARALRVLSRSDDDESVVRVEAKAIRIETVPKRAHRAIVRDADSERALAALGEHIVVSRGQRTFALTREPVESENLRTLVELGVSVFIEADFVDIIAVGESADPLLTFLHDDADGAGSFARDVLPAVPLSVSEVVEVALSESESESVAEIGEVRIPIAFVDTARLHLADLFSQGRVRCPPDTLLRGKTIIETDEPPIRVLATKQFAGAPLAIWYVRVLVLGLIVAIGVRLARWGGIL